MFVKFLVICLNSVSRGRVDVGRGGGERLRLKVGFFVRDLVGFGGGVVSRVVVC